MEPKDYNELRLDVLRKLIGERDISCKNTKDDMVKYLKMYDDGKYIRETEYQKDGEMFIVGIDLKNHNHLVQASKFVEKKEGTNLNRFSGHLIWYRLPSKLI